MIGVGLSSAIDLAQNPDENSGVKMGSHVAKNWDSSCPPQDEVQPRQHWEWSKSAKLGCSLRELFVVQDLLLPPSRGYESFILCKAHLRDRGLKIVIMTLG